jgi:hypothetical protein
MNHGRLTGDKRWRTRWDIAHRIIERNISCDGSSGGDNGCRDGRDGSSGGRGDGSSGGRGDSSGRGRGDGSEGGRSV